MTTADPAITPSAALEHLSSICPFAVRGLAKLMELSVEECIAQVDKLGYIALIELGALGAIELSPSSIKNAKADRFSFTEFFYEIVFCAHSISA